MSYNVRFKQIWQVVSGPRQGELLQEQETLEEESRRLQADMQRLQEDIQRRLAGLDVPFNPQTIEQPPEDVRKRQTTVTTTTTTTEAAGWFINRKYKNLSSEDVYFK